MRPLDEWDRSDLQALIDGQVQEWLQLDYKASEALQNTDGKKTEIAKDVSAFANSAGGRIIYGVVEDKRYPTAIDNGSDPTKITKEWIENVILSGISPRVDGVRVKEIALPNERAAFVIDIPQASSRAPHQAKDFRYYKRYEFQSVPMADYEVRDALRRDSKPDLVIWFDLKPKFFDDESGRMIATLRAIIANRSTEPALYATTRILLDPKLNIASLPYFERAPQGYRYQTSNFGYDLLLFDRHLSPNTHQPIYKEQAIYLWEAQIKLHPGAEYMMGFEVSYPGGRKQRYGWIRNASRVDMLPWHPRDAIDIPD